MRTAATSWAWVCIPNPRYIRKQFQHPPLGRGHDATVRRLAGRRRDGLPPAVRYWLRWVQNSVEERWAGVTRKWPDPWYARPGRLEQFAGAVLGSYGDEVPLAGTVWILAAETLTG